MFLDLALVRADDLSRRLVVPDDSCLQSNRPERLILLSLRSKRLPVQVRARRLFHGWSRSETDRNGTGMMESLKNSWVSYITEYYLGTFHDLTTRVPSAGSRSCQLHLMFCVANLSMMRLAISS